MTDKLHTLSEARIAKQSVKEQLRDHPGISLGIGQTDAGDDYAVLVMVEDSATARALPRLAADIPVRVAVTGKVGAF